MPRQSPTIVAFGEILWDMFPRGPRFGGAPANFSMHAAALGASVTMLSAVGKDDFGDKAIAILRDSLIDTRFVSQSDQYQTGQVNVEIDCFGDASYSFNDDEAWDHIHGADGIVDLAASTDAVYFGTLSQRGVDSRATLKTFLDMLPAGTLRVVDLNIRQPFCDLEVIDISLRMANVLKLNDEELSHLSTLFGFRGDEIAQARQLREKYDLQLIALTRGERGGVLIRPDEISEVPANPTFVRDTVGAGDSFTAAVTVGLLKKMPLDEINRAACRIAEYVCSKPGATPRLPNTLLAPWKV